MRTCLIGMRIAEEAGVGAADRSALYYALLLKDAGCSSNAGRMASLFGSDDQWVKPRMKLVDWHQRVSLAVTTATTVGEGRLASATAFAARSWPSRATQDMTRELIQIRCDRGAEIARQLGFPDETAEAIRSLDEHWCGLGYARGLAGERDPAPRAHRQSRANDRGISRARRADGGACGRAQSQRHLVRSGARATSCAAGRTTRRGGRSCAAM